MLAIGRRSRHGLGANRVAAVGAAAATAAAGAVHLALIGEHLAEGLVFGRAFVGMAGFQLGVVATSLELAALVLLVTVLPETEGRRWSVPAWVGGLMIGLATPILWISVTGAVQWAGPVAYRVPNLSVDTSVQGTLTPALHRGPERRRRSGPLIVDSLVDHDVS